MEDILRKQTKKPLFGQASALHGLPNRKGVFLGSTFCRNTKSPNISNELPRIVPAGSGVPLCLKVPYDSEIDALTAAATHLKLNEESESFSFRAHECPSCGKFHLTKGKMEIYF